MVKTVMLKMVNSCTLSILFNPPGRLDRAAVLFLLYLNLRNSYTKYT
nr:MAG TPA: hypothetical protein [Caudoviricetes sp.]